MARTPRKQSESGYYHVFTRGVGRQIIFEDDQDRETFLDMLADVVGKTEIELFAFCLMGNHYHLVVRSTFEDLVAFSYTLNRKYAMYFNWRHTRSGHLFQDRYCSQPIDSDAQFLAAIRYVHRNPVEAGISPTCSYPWSSYGNYLAGDAPATCGNNASGSDASSHVDTDISAVMNTAFVLEMLDGVAAFREFHQHPGKESFMDDRRIPCHVKDKDAISIARAALGGPEPSDLKSLPKSDRDRFLRVLKSADLTLTQIALVTGISRSVIGRACQS